jgi:hypothetical protein
VARAYRIATRNRAGRVDDLPDRFEDPADRLGDPAGDGARAPGAPQPGHRDWSEKLRREGNWGGEAPRGVEFAPTLDCRVSNLAGRLNRLPGRPPRGDRGVDDVPGRLNHLPGRLDDRARRLEEPAGRLNRLPGRLDDRARRLENPVTRLEEPAGRLNGLPGRLDGLPDRLDRLPGPLEDPAEPSGWNRRRMRRGSMWSPLPWTLSRSVSPPVRVHPSVVRGC